MHETSQTEMMPSRDGRTVTAALVQISATKSIEENLSRSEALAREAAARGAQIICFQELFHTLYFPAETHPRWYDVAEPVDGPTIRRMRNLARELRSVLVVPYYEEAASGIYYNTAVVIDESGELMGSYRKNHIPSTAPLGGNEKYYFKPGNLGYPVFDTTFARIGVYICYDRHFPEGARALALNGAELIFIPSATVVGLSENLWMVEPRSIAIANGCFVGAINRVGMEPLGSGRFYGSSYFSDPLGSVIVQGSDQHEDVVVARLSLGDIKKARHLWQFFRDRRPDTYEPLVHDLP